MTESLGRSAGRLPSWRQLRVSHLCWVLGAYFLGAVFVSIAHQLFGAAPLGQGRPTAYHRAWCGAQLAGLRVELETQARGALAGAAFLDPTAVRRRAWYPRWLAWHQRVEASCRFAEEPPMGDCLDALAALGLTLDRACSQVRDQSAPQREEVDRRLGVLHPAPSVGVEGP